MFAGLPCTGISGLIYLFVAMLMPFQEISLLLAGRPRMHRWRSALFLSTVAASIVWVTGATMWCLSLLIADPATVETGPRRLLPWSMTVLAVASAAGFALILVNLAMLIVGFALRCREESRKNASRKHLELPAASPPENISIIRLGPASQWPAS